MSEFYFIQFSDLHLQKKNFLAMKDEIGKFPVEISFILGTGDFANSGTFVELEKYHAMASSLPLPVYHVPGYHDLVNEPDAWEKIFGNKNSSFSHAGVNFILVSFEQVTKGKWEHQGRFTPETHEWMNKQIQSKSGKWILVSHAPVLPIADEYDDIWKGSNAPELLSFLERHDFLAFITGHWHRNIEWQWGRIRLINTAALSGLQWTGVGPYYTFPIRPGYRIFCCRNGELRSLCRELSPPSQVRIMWAGPTYILGPRPQVRKIEIFREISFKAGAFSMKGEIEEVEWSLLEFKSRNFRTLTKAKGWRPMERIFSCLWSEWEAALDPQEFHSGEYALAVRAKTEEGVAYDAIPIKISHISCTDSVRAGSEQLFELFYLPETIEIRA